MNQKRNSTHVKRKTVCLAGAKSQRASLHSQEDNKSFSLATRIGRQIELHPREQTLPRSRSVKAQLSQETGEKQLNIYQARGVLWGRGSRWIETRHGASSPQGGRFTRGVKCRTTNENLARYNERRHDTLALYASHPRRLLMLSLS